jgi:hypothetical protein
MARLTAGQRRGDCKFALGCGRFALEISIATTDTTKNRAISFSSRATLSSTHFHSI